MKKQLIKITITTLLIMPWPHSSADVSGKMIAFACYSCHGEKLINLNLPRPLSKNELTKTLLAFKSNKKTASIMDRITKGYTDEELESVATYLNGLN
jgi:sulfide dehydrogenase cytochrome subunit